LTGAVEFFAVRSVGYYTFWLCVIALGCLGSAVAAAGLIAEHRAGWEWPLLAVLGASSQAADYYGRRRLVVAKPGTSIVKSLNPKTAKSTIRRYKRYGWTAERDGEGIFAPENRVIVTFRKSETRVSA
jgi:hypothetical protein